MSAYMSHVATGEAVLTLRIDARTEPNGGRPIYSLNIDANDESGRSTITMQATRPLRLVVGPRFGAGARETTAAAMMAAPAVLAAVDQAESFARPHGSGVLLRREDWAALLEASMMAHSAPAEVSP